MTSRAPLRAAEIGQQRRRRHSSGQKRLRELESRQPPGRPGHADSQRDRPKDTGPGSRRHCRHGALPPTGVWPPGLLLSSGRLRYSSSGRVPSRHHQPVPLRPAGVSAPAARRPPAGPDAGACVFSQPAPREPTLPSWRAAGAGPRDPGSARVPRAGPGHGGKAGAPWLGAGVCSRNRSDLAGVRSAAQNLWGRGRGRSPRRAPRPCRRRSWEPDPERSRRARRAAAPLLALVPLAPGCGRACSLPPPSSFAGKLASPCCSPEGPLRLAWPSLSQSHLGLG